MGYVISHCIAHFQKEQKETLKEQEETLKTKSLTYIAQGIQCIVNGLANEEFMIPFADFIDETPEDTRTADEVVDDVLNKCGLGG